MTNFQVRGKEIANPVSKLELLAGPATVKKAVQVDTVSRAGQHITDLGDLADNDLLEIELDNGLVLWTTVEEFLKDTKSRGLARDQDEGLLPLTIQV